MRREAILSKDAASIFRTGGSQYLQIIQLKNITDDTLKASAAHLSTPIELPARRMPAPTTW